MTDVEAGEAAPMCGTGDASLLWAGSGPVRRIAAAVWIGFLGLPLAACLGDHRVGSGHKAVVVACCAAVALAYLLCAVHFDLAARWRAVLVAAMVGLIVFLAFYDRAPWTYELIFCLVPTMRLVGYRAWPVAAGSAGALLLGLASGLGTSDLLTVTIIPVGVGASMLGVARMAEANETLRRAEADRARVAVAEERVRFGRDLHDLLGHSLSVITLKCEVAGRLLAEDPDRARVEVAEVERTARRALREVREAVSGYRRTTLAVEAAGARTALAAAGITWSVDLADVDLDPAAEAALAWSVREGVTNVIRHSGARRCAVRLYQEGGRVSVEVCDDGTCGTGGPEGNGLRGLRERVELSGGTLVSSRRSEGGWRLVATVVSPAVTPASPPVVAGPR